MKTSAIAYLVLACAFGTATANPTKRVANGCTSLRKATHYPYGDVFDAIGEAEDGGAGGFPQAFANTEGFAFDCSSDLYQYPVEYDATYTGGTPGADRVVYDSNGDFCACVTQSGDDYAQCTTDTD